MTTDAVAERGEVDPAHPASTRDSATKTRGSEYAELSQQVKQAKLLNRRPGYYATRIGVNTGLLAGGWVFFVLMGNSWWQLGTAAFLAVMFTQVAFVGHDAGHRQIFTGRRGNDAVGLLHGNVLVGLSYGWWVAKHNRHHSHPNQVGRDPDVAAGFFVFTVAEARLRRGPARWLTRYQAYLFFPMLLLEGLNLHVESVRDLAARRGRAATAEAVLLVVHAAAYLATIVVVLSPAKAVLFVLVHQGLFGLYMGCAFAPNHKGMPILAHDETDFLRRQVLTSRNICGGRFTDLIFGGLNYQIEHHLFPSMPRPNLRRAQPLVREFCRARGVSYRNAARWGRTARRCGTCTTSARRCGTPGSGRAWIGTWRPVGGALVVAAAEHVSDPGRVRRTLRALLAGRAPDETVLERLCAGARLAPAGRRGGDLDDDQPRRTGLCRRQRRGHHPPRRHPVHPRGGTLLGCRPDGRPVLVGDLTAAAGRRWPMFTPAVLQAGFQAVFAFPLQIGAIRLGTLGLVRAEPGELKRGAVADALIVADVAALTLVDLPACDPNNPAALWSEVSGRYLAEIHQATGMVMAQLGVGAQEALMRLRAHAYAYGQTAGEVAREIVARRLRLDGDLPR
jgi:fatty acid desaturase